LLAKMCSRAAACSSAVRLVNPESRTIAPTARRLGQW